MANTESLLLKRLSNYTGVSTTDIKALEEDAKFAFVDSLRLNELKDIARFFKANGFSTIAMTGNKPYFVGLIIRLWKGDITQDSGGQVLPVATVSSEPAKLVSNHPAPLLHSLPRSVQAIAVPKQTPAPVPASRALPKQSLPHVFNEMNSRIGAILSTQEKREVYNILCGYPGMKKEEILNILAVWPPASALNLDEVMLRIISKRQSEESQLSMQQRMENEQYDRAVMESEKERDLAKIRKRQKLEDFKVKFEHPLLVSDELSTSCLLHGLLPPPPPPSSSGPSNSSSSHAAMIDLSFSDNDSEDEKVKVDRLQYEGSQIVREVVSALDRNCPPLHASSSSSSSSSSPGELSIASRLRKSLTNLLLTEVDCIKSYGRQSYPYIMKMGRRIDRVMQSFSQQQPRDMVRDTLAQLTLSTSSSKQAVVLQKIIEVLDRRHHKFTRGLYKLPTDGHNVPAIIRKTLDEVGLKLCVLDEDGVEEISIPNPSNGDLKVSKKRPASAMDELSDSTVSSWPEEEEDEDDDQF